MLKRIITLLTILMSLALITSCSKISEDISSASNEEFVITEQSEIFLSFHEALDISDCIAIGEFVSHEDMGEYIEYVFNPIEVLRGEIQENIIHLFKMKGSSEVDEIHYSYNFGSNEFETGEKYVLIMEKTDLLFYEYPHYVLVTDLYIPLKSIEQSTMYGKKIQETVELNSLNDLIEIIKSAKEPTAVENYANYTEANDIATIVAQSDYILEIKITGLMVEGILHNGNTYYCDVLNVLGGDADTLVRLENRDDVLITLFKDTVEVGEKYIVMVNRINSESSIYIQSSRRSIIPSDDTASINEIEKQLR